STPAPVASDTIVVTGIRASTLRSLALKREATANVDVITAVDIGKMPDKNLADSLQRVVGVAVRTDYDEAEKVSMRGTNPDMSLILFNGHTVSGGDWFVADQGSSSRSTSLSLMPSAVLNSATIYKTSQANVLDGGLAGTVNVTTRKPLSEPVGFGGLISLGAVHADLPGKTSPQLNASLNWKNDDNTFGAIGQVFAEKRYVRRDSVSRFAQGANSGWGVINTATMRGITDASLAGTGLTAAQLNGVRLPGAMASEFVEGVRDRQGGMLALQVRPTAALDFGATGFYSVMKAENYGRLYSGAMISMLQGLTPAGTANGAGNQVFAQLRNPVVATQTTTTGETLRYLQSAEVVYPGSTPRYIGNMGTNLRSGAEASSSFLDLDATWRPNDALMLKALASTTRGVGKTALDQGLVYARNGLGTRFQMNGLQEAPTWSYSGTGGDTPALSADGSGYSVVSRAGARNQTIDKESSLAIDGEYDLDHGPLQTLHFGGRFADHRRDLRRQVAALANRSALGPNPALAVPFPADFGSGLGGGIDRSGDFYFPRDVVVQYLADQIRPTTPEFERRVQTEIELRERQSALYVMQTAELGPVTGNVGVRLVRTQVDAQIATPIAATICPKIEPGQPVVPCARFPTAINTASDGSSYFVGEPFVPSQGTTYYKVPTNGTFDHVLPSLNLRWEVMPNLIARFGASKTIGRQNYNVYGSGFTGQTCTAGGCTVTGPNPGLEPMTAVNNDLSLSWYFNRRALLQVSLFDSRIKGYPKTGGSSTGQTIELTDPINNVPVIYTILSSSQQGAHIRGVELSWEQPLAFGFGVTANISRADTKVDDGRPMVGVSKDSRNLGLYFENDTFSVRLVYNYRSAYVASSTAPPPTANSQGLVVIDGKTLPTASTWAAPVATVALSANWNITQQLQLAFTGTNLSNPTRAQYLYSEAEQQKLDVSGRQYYLEARYKF
ncbi:MAG: TonB-dependent receptor, partial [Rubrivivax sp.]|nr:TonB-dependent receptor [Rubrivivax sp.]